MKLKMSHMIRKFKDIAFQPFFVLLAVTVLCSHDLYIKMETYFLQPDQEATLSLYNGTFEKSENIITRDRMMDASLIAHGERIAIQPSQWGDKDTTITQLTFHTGTPGTYMAGVATKARNIELDAEAFNDYLRHDGVLDMLEQRAANGTLDQDAIERYEKHVKAIYQVGDVKTDDWKTVLGYPIEFVPQANPYEKYSGEKLEVQLLAEGKPLADQLVYANYIKTGHTHEEISHTHDQNTHTHEEGEAHTHTDSEEAHTHTEGQQLRTDDQGIVAVDLPEDGIYYLRTIHMVEVGDSDEITHQSKWATLTFEVTHKHDETTHTHDGSTHTHDGTSHTHDGSAHAHDDHAEENGIPTWVFVLGSAVLIGVLFLVFRKKS